MVSEVMDRCSHSPYSQLGSRQYFWCSGHANVLLECIIIRSSSKPKMSCIRSESGAIEVHVESLLNAILIVPVPGCSSYLFKKEKEEKVNLNLLAGNEMASYLPHNDILDLGYPVQHSS